MKMLAWPDFEYQHSRANYERGQIFQSAVQVYTSYARNQVLRDNNVPTLNKIPQNSVGPID